ncbi:MAG: GNAT family N-acetyltransferase [Acidobacteria bacterium]|nr:GNAT family N-acetyltransferase [Acidobacteriota bacterium]
MGNGWEGEKVRLVGLDKERHLENALVWMNDPEVTKWTLIGDIPITRLAEEDYFNRMMGPYGMHPTDIALAVETLEGEHIGFNGFHRIEWRSGAAHTGTIIGAHEFRGKGYGADAARTRTRYAFEVLGLRLLLSEVMAENVASLKMLLGAGYREVGRIPRRHWKRGAYRDEVLLAVERESA